MADPIAELFARGFVASGKTVVPLPPMSQARSNPELAEILRGGPETHLVLDLDPWRVERLDEHPDVLAVSGPGALRVDTKHICQAWHDALALVVDEGQRPVVHGDEDFALVLHRILGKLEAEALERPTSFPPAFGPSADHVGLGDAEGWLEDELRTALGLGPFGHALAVGHHLRLADTPVSLADMLAGRRVPTNADSWLTALRPSHRRELRASFVAEVVRVGDLLRDAQELDPLSFDRVVVDLARGRDNLESLREVFWRLGMEDVDEELEDLDDQMKRFLSGQPFKLRFLDARLARARRVDPSAWWARGAVRP